MLEVLQFGRCYYFFIESFVFLQDIVGKGIVFFFNIILLVLVKKEDNKGKNSCLDWKRKIVFIGNMIVYMGQFN